MSSNNDRRALYYALLIEHPQGDIIAAQFPSMDEARDFDEEHEADILVRGCVAVYAPEDALAEATDR